LELEPLLPEVARYHQVRKTNNILLPKAHSRRNPTTEQFIRCHFGRFYGPEKSLSEKKTWRFTDVEKA